MTEVKVTTVVLEIRTVKLTKALLKQFRHIDRLLEKWIILNEKGEFSHIDPTYVVGWFHASVLGEEYGQFALLQNGIGDYFIWGRGCNTNYFTKYYKQIYVP